MLRIKENHESSRSKTRFDLHEIFGSSDDQRTNRENELNRLVFKRILSQGNFQNVLNTHHIKNKRVYLLYCKKMLMRLNRPDIIDSLEC